jgi:large subunit ribosomal protein L31
MKKGIHPEDYRMVVFKDMTTGDTFITRSTTASEETIQHEDGNEYPLVKLEISYKSHPFFTGKMQFVDTAGRIDKFKSRFQRHLKTKAPGTEAAAAAAEAVVAEEEVVAETVEVAEEAVAVKAAAEVETPTEEAPAAPEASSEEEASEEA